MYLCHLDTPVPPSLLVGVYAVLQAPATEAVFNAYDPAADSLSSLHLDCEHEPTICQDIAPYTNVYESSTASSPAVVAEAAAYLTSRAAGAGHVAAWDAVLGSLHVPDLTEQGQLDVLGRTNQYEGVQTVAWQRKRQAEEAGSHYLDISALDLECSLAAVGGDASTNRECRRSQAVNRYERDMRQPLVMSEPDSSTAGAGDVTASSATADLPTLQEVTGMKSLTRPLVAGQRYYYKNPCNSPEVHRQYKNPHNSNQQSRRRYYKNPQANAPAAFEALLMLPTTNAQVRVVLAACATHAHSGLGCSTASAPAAER